MTEPQTLASDKVMARFQEALDRRGLAVAPGPIDDTPTPDEPGHPEYHRLRRAEWALSRWETATPRRYRQATATHPDVIAWANRTINDFDNAGVLLLFGSIGTGKTHQAYGALRHIAAAGLPHYSLIATTAADMHGNLRVHNGDQQHDIERELARYCRVPLLFIDDIDVFKPSETTEQNMFRLINERYNECRPAIFTSNLLVRNPDGGPDLASVLGDRNASRLSQIATVVPITGPDRRPKMRNIR
ncbi:ATP-binding protein [Streptomyces odonnellii]|uniref:ATP-binding protein n=1 Tax=Streptomyces odonnellii TaxID=1417980 RepID=UPI0006253BA0|nr:ATP-binding protein [Streptomyces odonnellii]